MDRANVWELAVHADAAHHASGRRFAAFHRLLYPGAGDAVAAPKGVPRGRFTLAFLGYGPESEQTVLELTHNWDTEHYDLGDGYGHIALGVQDIQATCAGIADRGGRLVREPGPMKHGSTVIAFLEDPDGYKVELIELPSRSQAA